MKTKTIHSKIDVLSNRIKSVESKAENAKYLKESGIFQTLESDLEAALVLQKEVQTIRDLQKAKIKELKAGVKKLKKDSSEASKILKKVKKSVKPSKEEKIQKEISPSISKIPGNKKKTVKSGKKPAKHKK
jgi:hypothetical protein